MQTDIVWRRFSVRVPAELVHMLDNAARHERRNRNNLMWKILEEWLEARQTKGSLSRPGKPLVKPGMTG